MMEKCRISVFTPTYNRAYIIHELYASLQAQTFHDFEWLVVDDGSVDETEKLFTEWMRKSDAFPIRYYKQENGGKHRAVNYALDLAEGEIFFVVDSDDWLTPDALEKIDRWFSELPFDGDMCGIVANKGVDAQNTPSLPFSGQYLDKTLLEMGTYRENGQLVLNGERAMAFYTEAHRKYPYPVFDGEKFMTEAVVYNRMAADGYRMRFYNDIIWVYEYQEDGLTKAGSKLFLNNPRGYGLWLREKAKFEKAPLSARLKMYYTFTCDLSDRLRAKEIAECIGAPKLLIQMIILTRKLLKPEVESEK